MKVACGQCLGCRVERSQMWAARCVHESMLHDENSFITLTYRDEDMPRLWCDVDAPGTLVKKHFQDFMKRLRQRFPSQKIRYYHCGEYGDDYYRPHYHACLFGLDFSDKEFLSYNDGYPLFTSQTLEDVWSKGFVSIGEVTFQSAAYIARYCLKKVTGHMASDHYMRIDNYGVCHWLEPEYTTMSRGGRHGRGIGYDWYQQFKSDLYPSDHMPVPGTGVWPKVAKYYDSLLSVENPLLHDEIKGLRKAFSEAHEDEYTPERLSAKFTVKSAQLSQCKRGLR